MAERVGARPSPRAGRFVGVSVALAFAVVLVGCSGGGGASTSPSSSSSPDETSTSSTSSTIASASADSGVDGTINASGGVVDLGGAQLRHESGVVVTLERLLVEPSYVVLEFSAANGSSDKVALAGDTTRGITLELDDPAVTMTYQAPSVNETLELSSGEVLEAEIVFLGVLPADAISMDITFNPEPDPEGNVVEPTIHATGVLISMSGG